MSECCPCHKNVVRNVGGDYRNQLPGSVCSHLGYPALVLERQTSIQACQLSSAKAYTHHIVYYKAFLKSHPISSSQLVREIENFVIFP